MQGVTIVDHPLVQHKLTLLRDKTRSTKVFRELFGEIGALLCYEATRDLPLENVEIETPFAKMMSPVLAGKKLVLAPVGRAGCGFLDGILKLVPSARVAHVGLYRDPRTLVAVEYFFKAPDDMAERVDVGAAPDARHRQFGRGRGRSPEGSRRQVRAHLVHAGDPAIDRKAACDSTRRCRSTRPRSMKASRDNGYILPGLGDVGDRMYGTR